MSFDLSNVTANTTDLEIRHPSTGEPIGLTITLRPPNHPEVKKLNRENMNEALRDRGKSLNAAKVEARSLDRAAVSTEGWKFDEGVTINGEQPECSTQAARKLYKDHEWIRDQVINAIDDEARFYGGTD